MLDAKVIPTVFREGDEVVLAHGPYEGNRGVFVRLRKDANWAEICEANGNTRAHPLIWLARSTKDGNQMRKGTGEMRESSAEV